MDFVIEYSLDYVIKNLKCLNFIEKVTYEFNKCYIPLSRPKHSKGGIRKQEHTNTTVRFKYQPNSRENMVTETININRKAFEDLIRIKEDLDTVMESLELMKDVDFMNSYKKAKKQIENKEFAGWNELF